MIQSRSPRRKINSQSRIDNPHIFEPVETIKFNCADQPQVNGQSFMRHASILRYSAFLLFMGCSSFSHSAELVNKAIVMAKDPWGNVVVSLPDTSTVRLVDKKWHGETEKLEECKKLDGSVDWKFDVENNCEPSSR